MSDNSPQAMEAKYAPKPPKQVAAGIAQAEALRQQMNPPPETPQEPVQGQQPPGAPGGQPGPQTPPAASPPAQEPPLEQGETWEQRARSAQGRYENQMAANRQLNERLAQLENTISTMHATGQVAPLPETPPLRPQLVTDQEKQDFGEDFLTVVGKRAKEEYAPEFEQLASRLRQLEGRVDGAVQIVTRGQTQDVYGQLDTQIGNWRELNKSPQFLDWLQMMDPLSGRKRHDMLKEAFSRHEANRVLTFFRGFLTEAAGTPTSQPNPSPTPSSSNGANGTTGGALTLDQLAAPGRARSAPQGNLPPEKPVYTLAWIAQFMADKRTGKYRGREADADAIERDVYQAQHEGRISP